MGAIATKGLCGNVTVTTKATTHHRPQRPVYTPVRVREPEDRQTAREDAHAGVRLYLARERDVAVEGEFEHVRGRGGEEVFHGEVVGMSVAWGGRGVVVRGGGNEWCVWV